MSILDQFMRDAAARADASIIEDLPASVDPTARLTVQRVSGSLPDVPVEIFRAEVTTVKRYGNRETVTYSAPTTGPTDTEAWISKHLGIVSKGAPTYRKRIPFPREYKVKRMGAEIGPWHGPEIPRGWVREELNDPAPEWLRILMGPYWQPPLYGPPIPPVGPVRAQRTREEKEELIRAARKAARKRMGKRGIAR